MNSRELLHNLPLNSATETALLVVALPFFSFLLLVLSGKRLRHLTSRLATFLMGLNVLLTASVVWQCWNQPVQHSRLSWFQLLSENYNLNFTAGLLIDNITAMMLLVVVFISFLVHLFSIDYMEGDENYKRYFSLLGLFTAVMLALVLSDNLLLIFIFWELVGFVSYLLIGFWFKKTSASRAATKAFLVNRIGDVGFLVGILILWGQFSTLDLSAIEQLMANSQFSNGEWVVILQQGTQSITNTIDSSWLTIASLALFLGVMGKSAQFPLMAWLPDAMEGPTPVSALIHAATMVAAGVYLLARVFFLIDVEVHLVIAIVGVLTAFMGAVGAFTQHDIKKVLAFSTISQLGFMVMGMGVGAYSAALFHLMTHAFFKACLFLASGAVIHAMHDVLHNLQYEGKKIHLDAQDMRYMGGLRKKMPVTFWAYLTSTLALAGVPFFSGFLSKDAILTGALSWAKVMAAGGHWAYYLVPILAFLAAMMTAMYMGRQLLLVFFGEFRLPSLNEQCKNAGQYLKDVTLKMKVPLLTLTIMSFGVLYAANPFLKQEAWFLSAIGYPKILAPGLDAKTYFLALEQTEEQLKVLVFLLTVVLASLGFFWAYRRYHGGTSYTRNYLYRGDPENIWQKISHHNWFLDDVYQSFTRFNQRLALLSNQFDKRVVEGTNLGLQWFNGKLAKFASSFELKVLNGLSDAFGIFHIILAHFMVLIDRYVIDGFVSTVAWISGFIGLLGKSFQRGKVQQYVLWTFVSLILVLAFLLF
ncbi:NADH-quinone oxidoreductase subunit L [Xanthovirga aplysinae]|uniref:NADH-quinone oxidoreductase subunit L n=1 Tax=Xanthovirga aplysinae TaxID=2529853 RepID=UPI0016572F0C